MGIVEAVCISDEKGVRKVDMEDGMLIEGYGVKGDAHGGDSHRQISLLAMESIKKMQKQGLDVGPGDFGENIVTSGIELASLSVETKICLGDEAILRVSQIGKSCHDRCAIYYQAGDCIMPREGIFGEVMKGGFIKKGDNITIENDL